MELSPYLVHLRAWCLDLRVVFYSGLYSVFMNKEDQCPAVEAVPFMVYLVKTGIIGGAMPAWVSITAAGSGPPAMGCSFPELKC